MPGVNQQQDAKGEQSHQPAPQVFVPRPQQQEGQPPSNPTGGNTPQTQGDSSGTSSSQLQQASSTGPNHQAPQQAQAEAGTDHSQRPQQVHGADSNHEGHAQLAYDECGQPPPQHASIFPCHHSPPPPARKQINGGSAGGDDLMPVDGCKPVLTYDLPSKRRRVEERISLPTVSFFLMLQSQSPCRVYTLSLLSSLPSI